MSKNYWLHRITGGDNALPFSYPLLFNHNLLSIGWCDFSTNAFLEDFKQNKLQAIERAIQEQGWRLPRNRYDLFRFICEMKKGDVVVVPTLGGLFSIYEIADDEIFTNESIDISKLVDTNNKQATRKQDGSSACNIYNSDNKVVDLGFYRSVKPIAVKLSRTDYAESGLTSRMKILRTNVNIDDLRESVERAILRSNENNPINIKKDILDGTVDVLLNKIKNQANPDKFELLVEWYLKKIGGSFIDTPAKSSHGEGDADRVAYFETIKIAILVQVKFHKDYTDDWAVNQIKDYAEDKNHDTHEYTQILWVVSTCDDFSDNAKVLADEHNVRLINGREFCEMILEEGVEGFPI